MKKIFYTFTLLLNSLITYSATIVVQNTNDNGTGSLREAIANATHGDIIRFNPNLISIGSNTIVLTNEIYFTKRLTIIGLYNTTDTLFISGNNTNRIFNADFSNSTILTNKTLIIDSMVLINGYTSGYGGAILLDNGDSLLVSNSIISGNLAKNGGGISSITDYGSSYSSHSSVTVSNSIIRGNSASFYGGGIVSQSTKSSCSVTVNNSIISGNSAYYHGGGIFSYSNASSASPTPYSSVTVSNSIIKGNSANSGGGIYSYSYSYSSSVITNNSSISGNSASYSGGGIYSASSNSSSVTTNNSTINGNTANNNGGGIFSNSNTNSSSVAVSNNTISGNSANNNGGGIYSYSNSNTNSSSVTVSNSTISGNSANNNGGGIHSFADSSSYSITVGSSIIALNGNSNMNTPIISQGYNIFSDAPTNYNTNNDQINIDSLSLKLLPLAFNGGTTQTMLPATGSVAINMGNPTDMSNAQNGSILGGRRDVGAAESLLNTTGIISNHNSTVALITLYPNPTNQNYVFIEGESLNETNIKLFNIQGQEINISVQINSNKAKVNVRHLTNGVYFVKIFNGKQIFTKELIINK